MSPHETPNSTRSAQQTLIESTDFGRFPRGPVLRVELPDRRYENVLSGNQMVTFVMMNLSAAMSLIKNHGDFSDFLEPHHRLIITATEDDEVIIRNRYQVLKFLGQLSRSVYFIPDHIWVYKTNDPHQQREAIKSYLKRVEWFITEIGSRGLDVRVIPLAKGWLPWHFELHKETFDRLDITGYAFYGTQYVGGDAGNAISELVKDVHTSISILDPNDVLLIGRHSPRDLTRFRPEVVAAAGLRYWKDECGLSAAGYSSADLATWYYEAIRALRNKRGLTKLMDYDSEVMADG